MTLKFKQNNKQYKVIVKYENTGSNYNIFSHLCDEKGMLMGRDFKDGTSTIEIKNYYKNMDIEEAMRKSNEQLRKDLGL